jgi:short subunit dehydrogenase-like uncharacterized protein
MIYGANGYTGDLIAREAVRRGMKPILAGRSADAIEPLARELGCQARLFSLTNAATVSQHLQDVSLVVHCAGPFSATAAPMMDACLVSHTSYLDITGEIEVIEMGAARDAQAKAAGITLMPSVGFDVVPSDCLASQLAAELPGAVHLELAFATTGGLSPGTTKTMIEGMPNGGRARINGRIESVPPVWKTQEIPFRSGKRLAMTIPWGDVSSAYYSTGIPNIEVYFAASKRAISSAKNGAWVAKVTSIGWVRDLLKWWIGRSVKGPNEEQAKKSRCSLWGRVTDANGRQVEATLETPGAYPLTVLTALLIIERVLAGQGPKGFSTPSLAFGKDLILEIPGTSLEFSQRLSGQPA